MSLQNDIQKLMAARAARIAHQARARASITAVVRQARLASILARRDAGEPVTDRQARILTLLDAAEARRGLA